MSPGKRGQLHNRLAAGLVLMLALAVWLAYHPGLTASYYFDDAPNLIGLEQVSGPATALEFALSGQSGPTGRPLALASFLLNADDWPGNPERIRRVNVLIHVINSLLVVWLALSLTRSGGRNEPRAATVALVAGATWSLLPILVSTSMMITQRMTSLSALFVLLGLLVFVVGHRQLARSPRAALAGMSAGLVVFTALATLCKENGALLPVYALVTTLLLPAPERVHKRLWRSWKILFLWLPLILIVAFLGSRLPWSEATVAMRDFNAWERLLTQARVLWQYLFNAVLPMRTAQFGPFHDNVTASRSILEVSTLAAAAGWAAALWFAVAARKKLPVLSFAILWFLGGHLIESTVLSLELYFEHRNYLPLVGPAIALGWLVTSVPTGWTRFALAAVLGYIGLIGWTTASVTAEWGSPLEFAEEQYRAGRDSPRAAGFFASHLLAMDRPELALVIIDQAIARDNDALRLRLASMPIRCSVESGASPTIDVTDLGEALATAGADRNLARALHDLLQYSASTACPSLTTDDMAGLIDALSTNDALAGLSETRYWIHRSRALLSATTSDPVSQREQLQRALRIRFEPYALDLLVRSHLQDSDAASACASLERVWKQSDVNPLRELYVRLVIERMAREIDTSYPGEPPCRPIA